MSEINIDDANDLIQTGLPWAAAAGIKINKIKQGKVTMSLPFRSESNRPGGSISGPHMMMLADANMYFILLSRLCKAKLAVTTSFNINFLRKPKECELIATGSMIKLGKRLAVMEVSISDSKDLVAHATGTYSIPNISPFGKISKL